MTLKGKVSRQTNKNSKPPLTDDLAKQKQKAEQKEVAGRHKNDGQKGHKGRR
jgi:hypothetical protein